MTTAQENETLARIADARRKVNIFISPNTEMFVETKHVSRDLKHKHKALFNILLYFGIFDFFILLIARYVPNVAKRSI